jgi:SAM-dependent methyltransferase
VLSLGRTPLANALLTRDQLGRPEPTYQLDLAFCPQCSLVQLEQTVPPEQIFREYAYFSSFSDAMLRHGADLARRLIAERKLDETSLVIEAASNDGYLLKNYLRAGIPVLGIEPARNVARVAREEHGIPTVSEFFGRELANSLAENQRASVFHAHNVLAHVPDLNGFVAGIKTVLRDDGVAVIEAPYLKDFLDGCEFDTIYHEHLCYFSLTALAGLFRNHDLRIADVERVPIHGGSLRLFVTHPAGGAASADVHALLEEERAWGVRKPDVYQQFAHRVEALRGSLRELLAGLKRKGHRLAAYGAAAKGSTLLNYFGIGKETLEFVADRSTYKQGRYMPGTHLPIRPPDALLVEKPDYVLLLTWNFADEILGQQAECRRRGVRFILPVPEPRIV